MKTLISFLFIVAYLTPAEANNREKLKKMIQKREIAQEKKRQDKEALRRKLSSEPGEKNFSLPIQ